MNLIMLWGNCVHNQEYKYLFNEVLGDADPNDRVRFAILSSNFDRALNSMYQPRSEVTGVTLAELVGKILQSNQSIDIDNDLILHVQRVNIPRGNGNTKRKLGVNMGPNILHKRFILQPLDNMMTSPGLVIPWS